MQFFFKILMLLILFWISLIYVTRPRQNYQSVWHNYTACPNQQVCWQGIVPAQTTAQKALAKLDQWPEPLLIEVGQSGQSVQWQNPQGYQGYMVFNQGAIAFLEIQFPVHVQHTNQIQLADIILSLGTPAEIAQFPDGTTQLYYYDQWLIVRLDTRLSSRLMPDARVMSIYLASPYGQGITHPRGSIQGYPWRGFSHLPPPPPWTLN